MSLKNAEEGMVLGRSIYNSNGTILIGKGTKLNKNYIYSLKKKGIATVYIEDDNFDDLFIDEIVADDTKKEVMDIINNKIGNLPFAEDKSIQEVKGIINIIIDELLSKDDFIIDLVDIRAIDDYTFGHCVNVCILSLITGICLGYDRKKLIDLGTGAILHDIGKTLIPLQILNKPSKLEPTEYEEIKKHTVYGYKILKNVLNKKDDTLDIVLSHHERFDGKGYPNGLVGKEIHEYSRIVAVADVYDALTSNRVYRKKTKNKEAIEYLYTMKYSQFDEKIVDVFVHNVALYE